MKHEVDLGALKIHTDLAIEDSVLCKNMEIERVEDITINSLTITDELSKKVGRKKGNYITLEFKDVTDFNNRENVKKQVVLKLEQLLEKLKLTKKKCLVIGLGNNDSTPDSLGPLVVKKILVTRHIAEMGELEEGFSNVCAYTPGVKGQTGIESFEIINSLVNTIKPDFLIVIDALASQSIERLNKTIQITDSGINPGSGIGNNRKEISFDTLNIPVIAIGVPTVVDASTIVADTFNYIYEHFNYVKENINNPANKLKVGSENYLKKTFPHKVSREEVLGLVGRLNDEETRKLIYETLSPTGYNLMVTPKEIDFVINILSDLIGNAINQTLHENVTNM